MRAPSGQGSVTACALCFSAQKTHRKAISAPAAWSCTRAAGSWGCLAEGMGWECCFPHPCWEGEEEDAGSRTVGLGTPCLPAKGSVVVGTGLPGDGERSGYCRSSAEERQQSRARFRD